MVSITIATTTERKTVIVEEDATFRGIIEANGFNTAGMTYHLNGRPVADLDAPVAEGTLVAVPAQKAGC